jgi:hypothetical protein
MHPTISLEDHLTGMAIDVAKLYVGAHWVVDFRRGQVQGVGRD